MPSFRSSKSQAEHAAFSKNAIGSDRHENRDDGKIHSLGSQRTVAERLTVAADWMRDEHRMSLRDMTPELAREYLDYRSELVSQKTLDLDRQALQVHIGEKLERVTSEVPTRGHGDEARAYTPAQIDLIRQELTERERLAVDVCAAAGIRAHEIHSLAPAGERGPSAHRTWSADRFQGREGERYTVCGKGGLVREVMLPHELAAQLEAHRLAEPAVKTDRGIHYRAQYDIPGGKRLSDVFSRASRDAIGWSAGLHGLRHSYAQNRLEELQMAGVNFEVAKGIISQELGHFRSDITEVYLR